MRFRILLVGDQLDSQILDWLNTHRQVQAFGELVHIGGIQHGIRRQPAMIDGLVADILLVAEHESQSGCIRVPVVSKGNRFGLKTGQQCSVTLGIVELCRTYSHQETQSAIKKNFSKPGAGFFLF